jgi:hypothetical protein
MTIADLVDQLVEHSSAVAAATRGKAFEARVQQFTGALATIPDYPHAQMSQDHFDMVNRLAEQVIESIEGRLYDGDDGESLKQEMARSVYAIRKAQEEVFRWRKHFGGV